MQKTPDKLDVNDSTNDKKTPEKVDGLTSQENHVTTPVKKTEKPFEFRTPEKSPNGPTKVFHKSSETRVSENRTPEKKLESADVKSEQTSCEAEDEMISTTEQARLLMAASKTPSKSGSRTPAKSSTPSGKRSLENSPVTPGKFRRVELITLASPKAKRMKQM